MNDWVVRQGYTGGDGETYREGGTKACTIFGTDRHTHRQRCCPPKESVKSVLACSTLTIGKYLEHGCGVLIKKYLSSN